MVKCTRGRAGLEVTAGGSAVLCRRYAAGVCERRRAVVVGRGELGWGCGWGLIPGTLGRRVY